MIQISVKVMVYQSELANYSNFWSFFCPRICVGTWNVGGKLPPDSLDIDDWLDIDEPADIYVIG